MTVKKLRKCIPDHVGERDRVQIDDATRGEKRPQILRKGPRRSAVAAQRFRVEKIGGALENWSDNG